MNVQIRRLGKGVGFYLLVSVFCILPVSPSALFGSQFKAIAAGAYHSLALKSDGSIVAWGDNTYGEATPPDGNNFIAIAAGGWHSLALKSDGSIVAWGYNYLGQLTPPPGNDFIAIAAGAGYSIALKSNGSIVAWGVYSGTPSDGNNLITIVAGLYHYLALKSDGSIVAWGDNDYNECNVPDGNNFKTIAAGYEDSLALKSDGEIVAWGDNDDGECNVPDGNNFKAIATGWGYSLALKSDGSIVAWGDNSYGESTPPDGNNFIAIAAGWYHSLALKSDGSIVGWGDNTYGECNVPDGNNFIISVTKCTVTAGSKNNSDAISFSGTMDANADYFNDANNSSDANFIEVVISDENSDNMDPCVITFPVNGKTWKKGTFSYSGTVNGVKKSFSYVVKTGKFAFAASNINLSGLECPMTIDINVGDFAGTVDLNEAIVNGPKTPIPINLLMGVKNSLRIDKSKFTMKSGVITQFAVSGGFSVGKLNDANMADTNSVVELAGQTFTILKGSFKAGKSKFTCSKVKLYDVSLNLIGIASATFDFNKCTFTLTIKNTNFPAASGTTNLDIAFASFSGSDVVTLPP